jgi:hypothetical protein
MPKSLRRILPKFGRWRRHTSRVRARHDICGRAWAHISGCQTPGLTRGSPPTFGVLRCGLWPFPKLVDLSVIYTFKWTWPGKKFVKPRHGRLHVDLLNRFSDRRLSVIQDTNLYPVLSAFLICATNAKFCDSNSMPKHDILVLLKGQSHEKLDELRVWGDSLGPN